MENIRVPKVRLLETIRENRDRHRDEFLRAQEVYREKAIQALDDQLARARDRKSFSMSFYLPVPKDYTESYDTAIQMLEWETEDIIELSQRDFERYVLNQWEWAQAFAASTSMYLTE